MFKNVNKVEDLSVSGFSIPNIFTVKSAFSSTTRSYSAAFPETAVTVNTTSPFSAASAIVTVILNSAVPSGSHPLYRVRSPRQ